MEEMELSFKNKRVRMWIIGVLPVILLSAILFILLPIEYHWVPTFLPITAITVFYGWAKSNKKIKGN